MAIKSITEFTIQPGRRDEFVSLFESLVAQNLSTVRDAGCSEVTLCAVVDDPDKAVEIADWESARREMRRCKAGPLACLHLCSNCWPVPSAQRWSSRCIRERATLRHDGPFHRRIPDTSTDPYRGADRAVCRTSCEWGMPAVRPRIR